MRDLAVDWGLTVNRDPSALARETCAPQDSMSGGMIVKRTIQSALYLDVNSLTLLFFGSALQVGYKYRHFHQQELP
jgi:hypothetical protein